MSEEVPDPLWKDLEAKLKQARKKFYEKKKQAIEEYSDEVYQAVMEWAKEFAKTGKD